MPGPNVQLIILLAAVPIQYIISRFMTPEAVDREYMTRRLFTDGSNLFANVFNLSEWKNLIGKLQKRILYSTIDDGECPAKEVMLYNEPNGYFAGAPEEKTNRKNVKYRIGQVIKHKKFGYRGVIIGWDYTAKAPDHWLQVNHFDPSWRYQPSYSVLVDTRDRTDVQTTYVVEENLSIITDTKVDHPETESYFNSYDGSQYIPRPWLKKLYPKD